MSLHAYNIWPLRGKQFDVIRFEGPDCSGTATKANGNGYYG